jgi:hypothetical protein
VRARVRVSVCEVSVEYTETSYFARDDSAESRKEAGSGGSSTESSVSVMEASSAAEAQNGSSERPAG